MLANAVIRAAVSAAHVVCLNIGDARDLLRFPQRLAATLRD
ncbi:MAG: hypothetical protein WA970_18625 [Gammaproteobacteria bacterium]